MTAGSSIGECPEPVEPIRSAVAPSGRASPPRSFFCCPPRISCRLPRNADRSRRQTRISERPACFTRRHVKRQAPSSLRIRLSKARNARMSAQTHGIGRHEPPPKSQSSFVAISSEGPPFGRPTVGVARKHARRIADTGTSQNSGGCYRSSKCLRVELRCKGRPGDTHSGPAMMMGHSRRSQRTVSSTREPTTV
jgi:hypothetical protein